MTSERLLVENDVADALGVSVALLRKWRRLEHGPPFVRVGKAPRYRQSDIDQWLTSKLQLPPTTPLVTASGRLIKLNHLHTNQIDIQDIAHGLAYKCMYHGHTSQFYSYAEHCIRVAAALDPTDAAWALLHHAHAAYLAPPQEHTDLGHKTLKKIVHHYGLRGEIPKKVRDHDQRAKATEIRDLLPPTTAHTIEADPFSQEITETLAPDAALHLFLLEWNRNTLQRNKTE